MTSRRCMGANGRLHISIPLGADQIIEFRLDPDRPTRAEARAVQIDTTLSRTEGLLLDCDVSYRQLPQRPAAPLRPVDADPK